MATIISTKNNTSLHLAGAHAQHPRVLDFIVNFGVDATMGTATDDIVLGTLPPGAIVVSALIQQITAGTGSGTLALRAGTTAITGTLTSTAAALAQAANLPAATPYLVAAAGETLNLLGATAVRNTGTARVVVLIANGDQSPRVPGIAPRDASL
jgi:hypothetical protein